jgi:hypothetical protein
VVPSARYEGSVPGVRVGPPPKNGSIMPPNTAIRTLASRSHSDHASAGDLGSLGAVAEYQPRPYAGEFPATEERSMALRSAHGTAAKGGALVVHENLPFDELPRPDLLADTTGSASDSTAPTARRRARTGPSPSSWAAGDPYYLCVALTVAALTHVWRREPEHALAAARRALDVGRDEGSPVWRDGRCRSIIGRPRCSTPGRRRPIPRSSGPRSAFLRGGEPMGAADGSTWWPRRRTGGSRA